MEIAFMVAIVLLVIFDVVYVNTQERSYKKKLAKASSAAYMDGFQEASNIFNKSKKSRDIDSKW